MTNDHRMGKMCFIAPLHGIEIEGDLGTGVQLGDHGWIGTDTRLIESYIGDDWEKELGAAVIRKLHEARVFVYGEVPAVPKEQRSERCENQVSMIQPVFLDFLWVVRDNGVNCEMCIFGWWDDASQQWKAPVGISPTSYITKADGTGHRTVTKFSKSEIETVAGYMRGVTSVNPVTHVQATAFKTKTQMDRFALGRFFVHHARTMRDITGKIALYCSAFEAMLTTGNSEVAHLLAERVALMIEDDPEQRLVVYRRMKKIYNVRSKTMHGRIPEPDGWKSIDEVSQWCDEYMRKVIWSLANAPIPEMQSTDDAELETHFQKRVFEAGQVVFGFLIEEDEHAND